MTKPLPSSARLALLPVALGLLLVAGPGNAQQSPAAAEVIAVTKAQWAGEDGRKSAAQAHATLADDYTEFNGGVPVLLHGKALAGRMYEASLQANDKSVSSEMLNPHVQVYGDTAILTYNFAGSTKGSDGEMDQNSAKSTRVYVKQGGNWKLVHANFAPLGGSDD